MAVVDCDEMLQQFSSIGGIKLLWENLTQSVNQCCYSNSDRMGGLVSSVVNHLSPSLPTSTSLSSKSKRTERSPYTGAHHHHHSNNNVSNNSNQGNSITGTTIPQIYALPNQLGNGGKSAVNGGSKSSQSPVLVNFAPLAIVSSTHAGVRSPNSLVLPTQFLQRTKTPSWSHHFYNNDTFIVLTLKLPCPILLHEIILQPHSAISTYPSAVSVTAGLDGLCYAITGLIPTDTLSYVRLNLRSPIIASTVNVRLFKPKEYNTLGLSQIRLMGTTAFKGLTSPPDTKPVFVGNDLQRTQQDFGNCDWWLLLLKHCMTIARGKQFVLTTGVDTHGAVSACVNLLLAPQYAYSASNSTASGSKLCNVTVNKSRFRQRRTSTEEPVENAAKKDGSTPKTWYFDSEKNTLSLGASTGRKHNQFSAIQKAYSKAEDILGVVGNSDMKFNAKRTKTTPENQASSQESSSTNNNSQEVFKTKNVPPSTKISPGEDLADHYSGTSPLEQIILGLARQSPQWVEEFVAELLCHPRLLHQNVNQRGSGLRLLYSVCVDEGRGHSAGVQVLLYWLQKLLNSTCSENTSMPVSPSMLHTAAGIIWDTKSHLLPHDTDHLFKCVVVASCGEKGEMKTALDQILCALCYVNSKHFTALTAILADVSEPAENSLPKNSLSDCQLSSVVMAAHSTPAINTLLTSHLPVHIVCTVLEWCQRLVQTEILRCKKKRLSTASEGSVESASSPSTGSPSHLTMQEQVQLPSTSSFSAQLLMDSFTSNHFSRQQSSTKNDFVTSSNEVDSVAHLVWTLARLCAQPAVQDWMGQGHGALIWNTLLTVLGDPSLKNLGLNLSSLEGATIELLRKACLNHATNHRHIATHLCNLIKRQKSIPSGGLCYVHSLSGFTRSLVVQVLLECECILVEVEAGADVALVSETPLHWLPTPASPHPRHGLALNTRLLSLPLDTSLSVVVAELTDTSGALGKKGTVLGSHLLQQLQRATQPAPPKDEPMVICYDDEDDDEDDDDDDEDDDDHLVDLMEPVELAAFNKLSVAAGITAKDKRNKELLSAEELVSCIVNGVVSGTGGTMHILLHS